MFMTTFATLRCRISTYCCRQVLPQQIFT